MYILDRINPPGVFLGDTKDLEQLFRAVEDETTARARRMQLENELRRMEDYAESISVAGRKPTGNRWWGLISMDSVGKDMEKHDWTCRDPPVFDQHGAFKAWQIAVNPKIHCR